MTANRQPTADELNGVKQDTVHWPAKAHRVTTVDSDGNENTVQYPLATDGDSVYVKDIDVANSDNGNFSGTVLDLFNSLKTINTDSTANNPKTIKIWFNRSIQTNAIGFGCDDLDDSFSNIVIKALGSGEEVRYTKDLSSDSTKRNSYLVSLPPLALNGILLEFHTTDTICLSNLIIFKAVDVNARIKAVSSLTGEVENISSYRKALDVNSAWVHRKIVNETFHEHTVVTTTLSIAASEGDISITVTDPTGFIIGDMIKLEEGPIQEIGVMTITNVVGSVLTLDRPLANDYTTSAEVIEVNSNMAVLGTLSSPIIFEVDPPPSTIWQITRLLISITSTTDMDDGRFGGIPALTNGVVIRATTAAGRTVVFSNWKNNTDIKLDMYDVEYAAKAPAGQYGLRGRWTFTNAQIVAELDGDGDPVESMQILIQDDLTDLETFNVKAQGRVFSP